MVAYFFHGFDVLVQLLKPRKLALLFLLSAENLRRFDELYGQLLLNGLIYRLHDNRLVLVQLIPDLTQFAFANAFLRR